MPYKDPKVKKAYDAIYRKRHYERNKEAIQARVARNKKLARQRWIEYKSQQTCFDCGASHPAIIDFHHIIRDGTQLSVNRLAADNRWLAIYEEVKKCIPLCSNCHRIRHWSESRGRMITKRMPLNPADNTANPLESTNDDDSSTAKHS